MSVDFPAPEGPMIPMSSRWQNFPDRHLRRVLYPGGTEQHRFGFPEQCYRDCDAILAPGGTSEPPCVVPEAACAWSLSPSASPGL